MSKYLYKEGLYEKYDISSDIPVGKYKSYIYTEKDKIDLKYKEKIPLFYINNTEKNISYSKGILKINNFKIDVSLLKIKELFNILKNEGIDVQLLKDFPEVLSLPSYFLSEFNNTVVHTIDGDISPLKLDYLPLNKTIYTIEKERTNIKIIALTDNKVRDFRNVDEHLFYTVSNDTKIYITEKSKSFYIFGDYNTKQVYNGSTVANLVEQI